MKSKKTLALICGMVLVTGTICAPIAQASPFVDKINKVLSDIEKKVKEASQQGTPVDSPELAERVKDLVAEIPTELAKKETWDGVFPTNLSEVSTHSVWRALDDAGARANLLSMPFQNLICGTLQSALFSLSGALIPAEIRAALTAASVWTGNEHREQEAKMPEKAKDEHEDEEEQEEDEDDEEDDDAEWENRTIRPYVSVQAWFRSPIATGGDEPTFCTVSFHGDAVPPQQATTNPAVDNSVTDTTVPNSLSLSTDSTGPNSFFTSTNSTLPDSVFGSTDLAGKADE
ncbi:hypothetical protein FACS189481_5010 [Clostridia bacterium]|nr:hypothetical protein FACS189481_5010 [Clostridia bacterium]